MKGPKNKRIVRCKLVFKKKRGSSNESEFIYKAKVVSKYCFQIKGIDFLKMISEVVKHSSIRALLALVAMKH